MKQTRHPITLVLLLVTILTILEAIRKSQDSLADELSNNNIAELNKRGTFGGFIDEKMQSVIEEIRSKVEYDLNYSRKTAGRLEQCSYSKGVQSGLNGRTFKYHFEGGRFQMLSHSCEFSHGLCLNHFLASLADR